MPKTTTLIAIFCGAALPASVAAQQPPAGARVQGDAVLAPSLSTAVGKPQITTTTYQAPNFLNAALEPIKTDVAALRTRLTTMDSRENQRNSATLDALTALNASSTSQRGALADIQAALDRIETRLKKLEP